MRANHGKRPFARKSHSWTLAIGSYRTSLVDIAPAMKAKGATYPCAHVQVGEEAGNAFGFVAKSACCRKPSAQPCQPPNCHFLFRWPMKPSLRHAGNRSGCLVQSNRLRLEFTLIAGKPSSHPEFIAQTPTLGRPSSPSLAPPRSFRTRLFRQGTKNFCCAKLGPCWVFASLLALGQNLSGFRITRQAKGAGHEQTEVIMSNFELQEKAVKAATRFVERKGYELLETGLDFPRGNPDRPDRQRRGHPGLHRRHRNRVCRGWLRRGQGQARRP